MVSSTRFSMVGSAKVKAIKSVLLSESSLVLKISLMASSDLN